MIKDLRKYQNDQEELKSNITFENKKICVENQKIKM